jgi:hypothetical protein
VVSATDPHSCILLICTDEVVWTPFQTHYYLENMEAPGIEPVTSGSVARNSDHKTTEAVVTDIHQVRNIKFSNQQAGKDIFVVIS